MQNQQSPQATSEKQIVVISINVSAFGGYRHTTIKDIEDAGGKAPDTTVLTKGGKRIFPSDKLAPFTSNKRGVVRDIAEFGVKAFGNGYVFAISGDDLEKAEQIIHDGETAHNALLADLNANYDTWLEDYILAQPAEVQSIIRRSALSKDEALSKFGFDYTAFVPTPVGSKASVDSLQDSLTIQLYNEVADAAEELYDKSIAPKDSNGVRHPRQIGQKTKRPVVAAKEKLISLSFLHPGIAGGVELIQAVLADTQQTGYITDEIGNPAYTRFVKLVELMLDAPRFRDAAEKTANGDKDFASMLGMNTMNTAAPQGDIFRQEDAQQQEAPVSQAPEATPAPAATVAVKQPASHEIAFF